MYWFISGEVNGVMCSVAAIKKHSTRGWGGLMTWKCGWVVQSSNIILSLILCGHISTTG